MITKQRLEELIKQEATVYYLWFNSVLELKLKRNCYVTQGTMTNHKISRYRTKYWVLGDLYESEYEAREYLEFGNVTRTEKLELPTWEEFSSDIYTGYQFYTPKHNNFTIGKSHDVDFKNWFVYVKYDNESSFLFVKPLTKENYDEARRLCVKLFKGESV